MTRLAPVALGTGIVAFGVALLLGAFAIPGEASYAGVGPRAFPILIGAGLGVLGVAFVVTVVRQQDSSVSRAPERRGVFPWMLAGLAGAIVAIEPLGFPVAAAWLFIMAARAFASRRWLANALLGLGLGIAIYLAFAHALGVSLPGGLLERLLAR
jgi:putative tricarboxylic transport membrane protein